MKLFKKIAKAAGGHAKRDKDKGAAAAKPDATAKTADPAINQAAATVPAANAPATVGKGQAAKKTEHAAQGGMTSADEEASMRAKYESISKEREELKQRNAFLLQMLAVSQLDEKQLESEIQQHQNKEGLLPKCETSPVHKRF